MTTSPKRRRTRTVARKQPAKTAAGKKTAGKKPAAAIRAKAATRQPSTARRISAAAMADATRVMREGFLAIIRPRRPLAGDIVCATIPKVTSGTVEYDHAFTMTVPQIVAFICHGSNFGTGVPAVFTKTATGWSFEGSRPFCHIEKCSDGTASTDTVSAKGTIGANGTIAFTYEVRAYCGAVLVCVETGSYKGNKTGPSANLLEADFRGTTTWTLTCCPEPVWCHAIDPLPELPLGGRYVEPRTGWPKRKGR